MTSILLPFSPRVSVFDWDYEADSSDRIGVVYAALVEQRQLVVKKFCRVAVEQSVPTGGVQVDEFRAVRLVYIRQIENAIITSVVHSWLSHCGHFLLNCRFNAGGTFRSGLLVFDAQLTLLRTLHFGLTILPCYCYTDKIFYLPSESDNCIRRLSVPELQLVSMLDCSDAGERYVPQEAKSPFQVSVSETRILLCSFYTISRRVVLNAYSKEPFQLQAEMRLDFSPMRYVDSGAEIIWFEGGPQQHRVKIRYVTIDQGFFVADQEDSLSLLVPSRFTVPWLGSVWLFANRRGQLQVLECPHFSGGGSVAYFGGFGRADCQLCTSVELHRENRSLFSMEMIRELVGRYEADETGDCPVFIIYHTSGTAKIAKTNSGADASADYGESVVDPVANLAPNPSSARYSTLSDSSRVTDAVDTGAISSCSSPGGKYTINSQRDSL
ncbi:hypothetical protein BOX15_Mlig007284g1 [Macrostomum lignano]|uniref:Uncharacterized protein n=1 Tax=Macrostomum lignano TaxID=282301 RepID=A0A267H6D1_9PLAT|nr:hypothetical protein BOX15_Mlig007284g1 [Macrostomum lignano]